MNPDVCPECGGPMTLLDIGADYEVVICADCGYEGAIWDERDTDDE